MLRSPITAGFFVLAALSLAGLASGPVEASPQRAGFALHASSSDECPWAGEGATLPPGRPPGDGLQRALPPGHPPVDVDEDALPPGHPPVDGRASRLPPGHPPVGGARVLPPPRFDAPTIVDL